MYRCKKTIGQAKPEVVPSLIVMNSKGASLRDGKLVLVGVAPNAIIFADRPVRAAGHDLTANVIDDWTKGTDNFAKDPPNATVSGFTKDGSGVKDAVVVLKNPKRNAASRPKRKSLVRLTAFNLYANVCSDQM